MQSRDAPPKLKHDNWYDLGYLDGRAGRRSLTRHDIKREQPRWAHFGYTSYLAGYIAGFALKQGVTPRRPK